MFRFSGKVILPYLPHIIGATVYMAVETLHSIGLEAVYPFALELGKVVITLGLNIAKHLNWFDSFCKWFSITHKASLTC